MNKREYEKFKSDEYWFYRELNAAFRFKTMAEITKNEAALEYYDGMVYAYQNAIERIFGEWVTEEDLEGSEQFPTRCNCSD
jgi:hypothetical protein